MSRTLTVATLIGTVLISLLAAPVNAVSPSDDLTISAPSGAQAGQSVAVTFKLPAKVAAVDGRIFFDTTAVELVGIAPLGKGRAMTPQEISGGAAFGAYNLQSVNGTTIVRAVFVSNVSGKLSFRVVIDAAADRMGRRVSLGRTNVLSSLNFGDSQGALRAPRDAVRSLPVRVASPLRDIVRDGAIGKLDLDVVRAAWERGHGDSNACAAVPADADANGDGCVDIVDLQAVAANQGAVVVTPQTSSPQPTVAAGRSSVSAAALAEAVWTVNSTADQPDTTNGDGICLASNGRCTLRAAVTEANWHNGPDRINFDLSGSAPVAIQMSSNLSEMLVQDRTGGTFIDGYSQPGSRPNTSQYVSNAIPGVELRGVGQNAFRLVSASNVVRGFVFNGHERAIVIDGADAHDNVVAGNWLGYNANGSAAGSRGRYNIWISNGANRNVIGTPALADRNVTGMSTKGMALYGPGTDGNVIQNNLYCMTPGGTSAVPCDVGIDLTFGPKSNQIGGSAAGERNVIGPNTQQCIELAHGVNLDSSTTYQNNNNRILGNYLGFRPDGNYDPSFRCGQRDINDRSNDSNAIDLADGSSYNLVEGNWIGSRWDGILIMMPNETGNIVRNNTIGESPLGQPAPLGRYGVHVRTSAKGHVIQGNTIRNTGSYGVALTQKDVLWIRISRNVITDTNAAAIYLAPDPNNSNKGANNLLRAPVITSATSIRASGTGIAGATVEVYRATRNAGASGLASAYLGSALVTANGTWSTPIVVTAGERVTALQINTANNTSPLGTNVTATFEAPPPAPQANFTFAQRASTLIVDFTDTSTNTPAQWAWDFGDGTTSTDRNPSKTYSQAGQYTVSLTVTNAGGSSSTNKQVTVQAPPAGVTYAADAFGRTTGGWGTADVGGAYTLQGSAANYNVGSGAGTISVPTANSTRSAILNTVSQRDVDIRVRVSVDKVAAGGNYFVYEVARRNGNSEYRPRMIFNANGTVSVNASVLVNGSESSLGAAVVVPGLTQGPNQYIWLRASVTGANPTTVSVKAWADGQAEPAGWQFTATNSQAGLQAAGAVGLRTYLAGPVTTAPVTFAFDDYSVVEAL